MGPFARFSEGVWAWQGHQAGEGGGHVDSQKQTRPIPMSSGLSLRGQRGEGREWMPRALWWFWKRALQRAVRDPKESPGAPIRGRSTLMGNHEWEKGAWLIPEEQALWAWYAGRPGKVHGAHFEEASSEIQRLPGSPLPSRPTI